MSSPSFRLTAAEAKVSLLEFRKALELRHDAGESASGLSVELTKLTDQLLVGLANEACHDPAVAPTLLPRGITLVAIGGFGRGDLAPHSDVDLLILIDAEQDETNKPWVRKFSQDLWGTGLQPAVSVRDIRGACQASLRDATIFTALIEARFLWGDAPRYEAFKSRFGRLVKRRAHALVESALAARREERLKYGETVYLLSPNVKRSRGGLRDMQLIRWLGFARYGTNDYDQLAAEANLTAPDHRRLMAAREFLLRVRFELHFRARKAQDQLTRDEQVRVASKFGYQGSPGVLPVEQFMTDYFEHTSQVRYVTAAFTETARARFGLRQLVGPMFSFNVGTDFRVGPIHVTATRSGLKRIQNDLVEVLRLMDLASTYDRRIDHHTWTAVRESMLDSTQMELTPEVGRRFIAILAEPKRLGDMLRRLHELRVLERIVPAFRRARCLLQFNEYHKFTVDEHCIRAVEAAAALHQEESPVAEVYRSIKRPDLLHLALLLHDVGKGDERDHSIVGEELAEQTCIRLGLGPEATRDVKFLVRQHLRMIHLAMWRDIGDEAVVASLASELPSLEVLKMLFVLSYADLAAVAPAVVNAWKVQLLVDLYYRTANQLTGRTTRDSRYDQKSLIRLEAAERLGDSAKEQWQKQIIQALPSSFLEEMTADDLVKAVDQWALVTLDSPFLQARYLDKTASYELVVVAVDRPKSGYFHRTTGTLTSMRFEILSVDAVDLPGGRIANRYLIQDLEHSGQTPELRLSEARERLLKVLVDPEEKPPAFRAIWKPKSKSASEHYQLPSRVLIDNDTAESMTIVDVFTSDRTGLLYGISRVIFELDLEVRFAKIGTHLDQVVDVFYVTDLHGAKLTDPERLKVITEALYKFLESLGES